MKKLLAFFLIFSSGCNTGELKVIMDIPASLKEVSGLEVDSDGTFWMINDSGNAPILYGLDSDGKIIRKLKIDAKNRDWEDLTLDSEGNLYIGDFGNNQNDRKHLKILKISKDDLHSTEPIVPDRILFNYPEQKKFPPKKGKRFFDCESFFFYRDSLYLFTKSRTSKHPGKTSLYVVPSEPGKYEATLKDTFNTCNENGCWVTSADINNQRNKVALLTEKGIYIFSNFNDAAFFDGKITHQHQFSYASQKESVCFKNDSTLYIADERNGPHGGNMYEYSLSGND